MIDCTTPLLQVYVLKALLLLKRMAYLPRKLHPNHFAVQCPVKPETVTKPLLPQTPRATLWIWHLYFRCLIKISFFLSSVVVIVVFRKLFRSISVCIISGWIFGILAVECWVCNMVSSKALVPEVQLGIACYWLAGWLLLLLLLCTDCCFFFS